ncbi:MAG: hypothetical protein AB1847_22245, partial [bacterium]
GLYGGYYGTSGLYGGLYGGYYGTSGLYGGYYGTSGLYGGLYGGYYGTSGLYGGYYGGPYGVGSPFGVNNLYYTIDTGTGLNYQVPFMQIAPLLGVAGLYNQLFPTLFDSTTPTSAPSTVIY